MEFTSIDMMNLHYVSVFLRKLRTKKKKKATIFILFVVFVIPI